MRATRSPAMTSERRPLHYPTRGPARPKEPARFAGRAISWPRLSLRVDRPDLPRHAALIVADHARDLALLAVLLRDVEVAGRFVVLIQRADRGQPVDAPALGHGR